ncbi:DUF3613 domain-containing protein [Trinickia sp. NRRL B-1857]|uniref:DUF3613 domain-containing protein n=1 Tax=Trinickia sp. NRRL B-1857 TaxID=3162879 RepID=UPI003D29B5E1
MYRKQARSTAAQAALALALILSSLYAVPEAQAQSREHAGANEIGRSTEAWLALQRSNAAAAPALPMPGAQATLAYERYMNSFRTKIPESFGSTLSGESGTTRLDRWSGGSGATQPAGTD